MFYKTIFIKILVTSLMLKNDLLIMISYLVYKPSIFFKFNLKTIDKKNDDVQIIKNV